MSTEPHNFVPQDDYYIRLCGICGMSKSQHGLPVPRAGERERVILNSDLVVRPMPNTLLKTKYLLTTDDDWPVAEFYREEEAEGIAYEHNQYATLIEQREQLAEIISMTICHGCHNRIGWNETPTKYGDWTKCSSCRAARELLATIEREEEVR